MDMFNCLAAIMENGWYFPASYEDWIKNGTEEVVDNIESGEIENVLFAEGSRIFEVISISKQSFLFL